MPYNKGDYIRYSSNGVCVIDDIVTLNHIDKKIKQNFYLLRPLGSQKCTIYVPMDNENLTSKMKYI